MNRKAEYLRGGRYVFNLAMRKIKEIIKMKKLLIVVLALVMCLGLTACGEKGEDMTATVGLSNPVVSYDSLNEINEKVGVNLLKPSNCEVTNESFSVIADNIAQYTCEIDGREWIFRAAHITEEDISGMHDEHNEFTPNQDSVLYVNEFYLDRFFDGDKQYTIVSMNPISEDGDILLDEMLFSDICMELKLIQQMHMDDPLVGDYQDTVSQRATACVERFGDVYNVSVNWSDSDSENHSWTMYEATLKDNKLTYNGEEIGHYTYDEEGNVVSSDETASNNVGYFEVKDNMLYWTGASQESCRECVFEKIVY